MRRYFSALSNLPSTHKAAQQALAKVIHLDNLPSRIDFLSENSHLGIGGYDENSPFSTHPNLVTNF